MMKRILILLLALLLTGCLFACDKGGDGGVSDTADYFSDPEAVGATLTQKGDSVTVVEEYQAQVDLLKGKKVTVKAGSTVWDALFSGMPTEMTVRLNEEGKTFLPISEG